MSQVQTEYLVRYLVWGLVICFVAFVLDIVLLVKRRPDLAIEVPKLGKRLEELTARMIELKLSRPGQSRGWMVVQVLMVLLTWPFWLGRWFIIVSSDGIGTAHLIEWVKETVEKGEGKVRLEEIKRKRDLAAADSTGDDKS